MGVGEPTLRACEVELEMFPTFVECARLVRKTAERTNPNPLP